MDLFYLRRQTHCHFEILFSIEFCSMCVVGKAKKYGESGSPITLARSMGYWKQLRKGFGKKFSKSPSSEDRRHTTANFLIVPLCMVPFRVSIERSSLHWSALDHLWAFHDILSVPADAWRHWRLQTRLTFCRRSLAVSGHSLHSRHYGCQTGRTLSCSPRRESGGNLEGQDAQNGGSGRCDCRQ